MAAKFTPEALAERQKELKAEIGKITAITGPKRAARDKHVQEADAKRKAMNAELKALEGPLAELHREAAMIAKALGGKSMNTTTAGHA
jgi:hypothetical protein